MNHLYYADNLTVMQTLPDASVDIIYADPPFNTGRDFTGYTDRWHPSETRLPDALSAAYPETQKVLDFVGGEIGKPTSRS